MQKPVEFEMTVASFILAQDQGVSWDKMIPIVVIAAIWIIGGLLNQKKSPPRVPPQREAAPPVRLPPGVIAQQVVRLAPTPARPRRAPATKNARAAKQQATRRTAVAAAPVVPVAPVIASTSTPSRVEAPGLARRLRPGVLRKQFILTEILRPPVSMRQRDQFSDFADLS
jgi:hypothetical protein